jgi:hypothetical protein
MPERGYLSWWVVGNYQVPGARSTARLLAPNWEYSAREGGGYVGIKIEEEPA